MAERRFISPILEKIRREEAERWITARDIGVSYVKEVDKRRVFRKQAAITNLAAFEAVARWPGGRPPSWNNLLCTAIRLR